MKVLVIDNYDSFTYNLVHIIRALGYNPDIYRNDKIPIEQVEKYDKILLSPGPGVPSEAGFMPSIIEQYKNTKSILGVCLGHQAIGEAFNSKIYNLPIVFHGITTDIQVTIEDSLFKGLPKRFSVCRYHSWVIDKNTIDNNELEITSVDDDGIIMGVRHKNLDIKGVQFHPESVMTAHGIQMMKNWLTD